MLLSDTVLPRGSACLACRKRKMRCDGGKPVCEGCIRGRKECIYNERPSSSMSRLVQRVQELEQRLASATENRSPSPSICSQELPTNSKGRGSGSSSGSVDLSSQGSSSGPVAQVQPRNPPGNQSQNSSVLIPGTNMVWQYDPTMPNPDLMQLSDMSPRLRESLIELFLQNRSRCFFELHVPRFISSLTLPSSDERAPHGALVDAMLLVGCYFSRSPSLAGYELSCLTHALNKLSESLKETDRLHDYIRASNLISFYYLSKGLYQEASQQLVASTHMAVTCGLHQIVSSVWRPPSPQQTQNKFLPPANDNIELGERIYTFWQTFCFDKMVAMAAEKKPYLSNGSRVDHYLNITTPWPMSFVDYETGNVSDIEHYSISSIYTERALGVPDFEVSFVGISAQGFALVSRALEITETGVQDTREAAIVDNALQHYATRLPDAGTSHGQSTVDHRLSFGGVMVHTATLVLHQFGSEASSRQKCTHAMHYLVQDIGVLTDADYDTLPMGIGYMWYIAARILVTISFNATGAVAEQSLQAAHTITSALKKLGLIYPPLGFQIHRLDPTA